MRPGPAWILAAQGFAVGLAYVAPVGSQNLYVMNCAMGRTLRQGVKVAMSVAAVDAALAWACTGGVATLMVQVPGLRLLLGLGGGGYLAFVGASTLAAARRASAPALEGGAQPGWSWRRALMVTWLNPQAIVDGSLLFGGMQLGRSRAEVCALMMGAAMASLAWFVALAAAVCGLGTRIDRRWLRGIHGVCGLAMVALGLNLLWKTVRSSS